MDGRFETRPTDRTDLLDYVHLLAKGWKLIVINFVVVVAIATIVSLLLPKWYKGVTTIMPPREQKGGFGYADILETLSLPTLELGQRGTPTDIFKAIIKSRTVRGAVADEFNLMEVYKVKRRDEAIEQLGQHLRVELTDDGLIRIEALDRSPVRAADIANSFAERLDAVNTLMNQQIAADKSRFYAIQLEVNEDSLKNAQEGLRIFQEQHKAISIPEQAHVAIATAAEMQVDLMQLSFQLDYLKESALDVSHPQVQEIESRIRIRRKQLREMERGPIALVDPDQTISLFIPLHDIPELTLQYAHLESRVTIYASLRQLLLYQFHEAKISLANDTQSVQIMDRAIPPRKKFRPLRKLIVSAAGAGSLMFSLFVAIVVHWFSTLKQASPQNSEKIAKILHEFRSNGMLKRTPL